MKPKDPRRHSVHGLSWVQPTGAKVATDLELIREVLFAFQGLSGKILIQDPDDGGRFKVNPDFNVTPPSRKELALRLTNLGWLFSRIQTFSQQSCKHGHGLVNQSLAAALGEQVHEYYRLVAIIEQQLHQAASDDSMPVSLHRLQLWTFDHFYRLKSLAQLVDDCRKKRGGALANAVYQRMQTGDPAIKSCLTLVLRQVVLPLRRMLCRWIFYGELDDPYKEFFVTARSSDDALDRFTLNEQMLPTFVPKSEAKKILATGKAVNLLLSSGAEPPECEDLRQAFETSEVDQLFRYGGEFRVLLDSAFKEASGRALKVLMEDHSLMLHLEAVRSFLLLGQGDFIRHLMDLLAPELDKPAHRLIAHSLNSLFSQAIRATNAQFASDKVIRRVDCVLLDAQSSVGETGWDMFTLVYKPQGPVSCILTNRAVEKYSRLFQHLWRSKRMEYLVTKIRKEHFSRCHKPLMRSTLFLLQEMTHFVQQMQYYIEFEVIECSWSEFIASISTAKHIDALILAHEKFLNIAFARAMLDVDSHDLFQQLRAIYDCILEFNTLVTKYSNCSSASLPGAFCKDEYEDEAYFTVKFKTIGNTYRSMVNRFLLLLADQRDVDLKFLSTRIDFNEHYRKQNKDLETSFTYSRHRASLDHSSLLSDLVPKVVL